jgi:hypothetical protein
MLVTNKREENKRKQQRSQNLERKEEESDLENIID